MTLRDRANEAARAAGSAIAAGKDKFVATGRGGADFLLNNIEPPAAPVTEVWELSVAEIVRRRDEVPSIASRALGLLDRFGAVRLSPELIGFDDDDVDWSRVVSVRTLPVTQVLSQTAVDRELERIRKLLPPVPGRKWVLSKVGDGIGELALAGVVMPVGNLAADFCSGCGGRGTCGKCGACAKHCGSLKQTTSADCILHFYSSSNCESENYLFMQCAKHFQLRNMRRIRDSLAIGYESSANGQ